MTRDEHLAWCKKRAHAYLAQGDVNNAITSMMSDLTKHPETASSGSGVLSALGRNIIMRGGGIEEARRYIDGFN